MTGLFGAVRGTGPFRLYGVERPCAGIRAFVTGKEWKGAA